MFVVSVEPYIRIPTNPNTTFHVWFGPTPDECVTYKGKKKKLDVVNSHYDVCNRKTSCRDSLNPVYRNVYKL